MSALNGSPSWKVTPVRSVNSHVRSSTGFHGERQARHRLALRGPRPPGSRRPGGCSSSGSSPCRSGVHVVRVVGERDHELRLGVDRRAVDRRRAGRRRRAAAGASAQDPAQDESEPDVPLAGVSLRAAGNPGHSRFLMASSSKSAAVRARLPPRDRRRRTLARARAHLPRLPASDVAGQSVVDQFVKQRQGRDLVRPDARRADAPAACTGRPGGASRPTRSTGPPRWSRASSTSASTTSASTSACSTPRSASFYVGESR